MINIAEEFTTTPGPRAIDEGPFSGEEFLNDLLKPRFELAAEKNEKLLINLDGTEGYATSFLEAAFGGLTRIYGKDRVLAILDFASVEEPYLIEEIINYIQEANGN